MLGHGWHVNLQKPMCSDLASARLMLDAAETNGRVLRVMENYIFYQPLQRLKEMVASGEIGEVAGYHMKMVGSGRGGWDVPASSYEWQLQQMQRGRGILVFDDGWHKLATALWLFGPITEVRAWVGNTPSRSRRHRDRRALDDRVGARQRDPRRVGHHAGGRHVAPLRLLHQRRAMGGDRSSGVCPRQPLHRTWHPAAQPRGVPRRRDARIPRPRRRLGQQLPRLRPALAAVAAHRRRSVAFGGEEAVDVLRFALAVYESSAAGGVGVNPASVEP